MAIKTCPICATPFGANNLPSLCRACGFSPRAKRGGGPMFRNRRMGRRNKKYITQALALLKRMGL